MVGYQLDDDADHVMVQVFVSAPHHERVRSNTKFWNASGIDVSMSPEGFEIDSVSLTSMLIGGVAFETPRLAAEPAAEDHVFPLYANKRATERPVITAKRPFLMHFEQSAGGLVPGSPVDFRGIIIGQVRSVHLDFDEALDRPIIPVVIDIEPERIKVFSLGEQDRRRRENWDAMVAQGLRAQLTTHNLLTGQLAVSFDFHRNAPPAKVDWDQRSWWPVTALVALCVTSKTVMDFTSSGLETPLVYLLLSLFWVVVTGDREWGWDRLSVACGVAALCFLNRQDSLLLCLPALGWLAVRDRTELRGRLPRIALALAPAGLWLAFSLFYYGSLIPNTAYAKVVCNGLSASEKLAYGVPYVLQSLRVDWLHTALIAVAAVALVRCRDSRALVVLAGAVLYLGFVAVSAAASTHMMGKLVCAPLFVGFLAVADRLRSGRHVALLATALALFAALNASSPLRAGVGGYERPVILAEGSLDTRDVVRSEGPSLVNYRPDWKPPNHKWYDLGIDMRTQPGKVVEHGAVGFFAFAVGPEKHLLDTYALTDPLRSRLLPARKGRSGHFRRDATPDYIASIRADRNLLWRPDLHEIYNRVRSVTRDPLLSRRRLEAIGWLQLRAARCYPPAGG